LPNYEEELDKAIMKHFAGMHLHLHMHSARTTLRLMLAQQFALAGCS
jgi:hypothetical protein